MARQTTIREIPKGEYFTLKDDDEPKSSIVWVRGEYIRRFKAFSVYKFDDICHDRLFKGTRKVFVDFYF